MSRISDDAGVATVWSATAIAAVMAVMLFGAQLGMAAAARHRAEAAADLAALAAAAHAVSGPTVACVHGRRVSDGMSATLASCRLAGWDAVVEVRVRSPVPLIGPGTAVGRARAGPVAR